MQVGLNNWVRRAAASSFARQLCSQPQHSPSEPSRLRLGVFLHDRGPGPLDAGSSTAPHSLQAMNEAGFHCEPDRQLKLLGPVARLYSRC